MLSQHSFKLSDSDELIVINELNASTALEFGAILGNVLAGSLDGMADFGGNLDDTEIHLGKVFQGPMNRLLNKEFAIHIKSLLRHSLVRPDWDEDWFNDRFSAKNMPALWELVTTIIEYNYGPIAEILKKKTPFITVQLFFSAQEPLEQQDQSSIPS